MTSPSEIEAIAERVASVISDMIDDEILAAAELVGAELPDWDTEEEEAERVADAIFKAVIAELTGDK